jgi:hypothetical protein
MALFASIVAFLAFAGALASWIVGAWFYARTLRALAAERGQTRLSACSGEVGTGSPTRTCATQEWLAIVAWPFALGRLKGAAAAHAAKVNKALVAFLACLMLAVAATSVATNLARVSR